MEELINFLLQYGLGGFFVLAITFVLIGFGVIEFVKKIKGYLDAYHKKRVKEENYTNEIDERFNAIEAAQKEDHEEIMSLQNEVGNIRKLIETLQQTQEKADAAQKKANRAQSRSAMMRLANELIVKEYMTEIESETLNDLVAVFMQSASENDGYVIPNLVARALKLPVLTADEIDRKSRRKEEARRGKMGLHRKN